MSEGNLVGGGFFFFGAEIPTKYIISLFAHEFHTEFLEKSPYSGRFRGQKLGPQRKKKWFSRNCDHCAFVLESILLLLPLLLHLLTVADADACIVAHVKLGPQECVLAPQYPFEVFEGKGIFLSVLKDSVLETLALRSVCVCVCVLKRVFS